MANYASSSSVVNVNDLTCDKALENRVAYDKALYEQQLSSCFTVSVEGHERSLYASNVKAIYSKYFRSCGEIFNIVVPSDPETGVVERLGFIYFMSKAGQEKALALSGSNVGFPLQGRYNESPEIGARLGGWDVVVEGLRREPCEFSPDELAERRRLTYLSFRPSSVVVTEFDTSCSRDVMTSALYTLFSPCGEIIWVRVIVDHDQPGRLKRLAFVCLNGEEACEKAIKLDGSDLGGWKVVVSAVEPTRAAVIPPHLANIPIGQPGPPGYRWYDTLRSTNLH